MFILAWGLESNIHRIGLGFRKHVASRCPSTVENGLCDSAHVVVVFTGGISSSIGARTLSASQGEAEIVREDWSGLSETCRARPPLLSLHQSQQLLCHCTLDWEVRSRNLRGFTWANRWLEPKRLDPATKMATEKTHPNNIAPCSSFARFALIILISTPNPLATPQPSPRQKFGQKKNKDR